MEPASAGKGTGETGSAAHVRMHRSLTAAPEKRVLVWMAGRMPAWVNSDHLSALGFVAMAGVGASFWLAGTSPRLGLPLVVVCLVLNWFGDSLDGTLARVRNRLRPRYGFYLDHVLDIAGEAMMLAGLAASGYMDPLLAAVTLTAWLLVMSESFLATFTRSLFRMSFWWFGPTELRILIAIGALKLLRGDMVHVFGWGPYRLFDIGGACATAGLIIIFVANAARNAIALYREETRW